MSEVECKTIYQNRMQQQFDLRNLMLLEEQNIALCDQVFKLKCERNELEAENYKLRSDCLFYKRYYDRHESITTSDKCY